MSCFLTTGVPCALTRVGRPDAFEIHVTVTPLTPAEREHFFSVCSEQHWKALVIELDPHIPSQPMTCSRIIGPPDEATAHALAVRERLEQCGFTVTRVKIEAAPWNNCVPQTDEEAVNRHTSAYFEFHAKLVLPITGWESRLPSLCQPFQAHISHNPFRLRSDNTTERFVTMRSARFGLASFQEHTSQLTTTLETDSFPITNTVTEYCVYDSNATLDAAWFRASPMA